MKPNEKYSLCHSHWVCVHCLTSANYSYRCNILIRPNLLQLYRALEKSLWYFIMCVALQKHFTWSGWGRTYMVMGISESCMCIVTSCRPKCHTGNIYSYVLQSKDSTRVGVNLAQISPAQGKEKWILSKSEFPKLISGLLISNTRKTTKRYLFSHIICTDLSLLQITYFHLTWSTWSPKRK